MHMTNNPRIYLWVALAIVLYFNYEAWMRDYGPGPGSIATTPSTQTSPGSHGTSASPGDLGNRIPEVSKAQPATAPTATPNATVATTQAGANAAAAEQAPNASAPPDVVHVHTDVLDADIGTRGGTIQRADLLKYPKVKGEATPVRLENQDDPQSLYVLETGLACPGNTPCPTHLATFTSPKREYRLDGAQELRVPLTWTNDGVTVTKTYIFHRGDYRVGVEYTVQNHGDSPWQAAPYAQILRNDPRTKRSMFNVESYAFHGPAIDDGKKYRKLDTSNADESHFSQEVRNGWLAALQHHFVTAIVPPKDTPYRFTLNASGDQYLLAGTGPTHTVAPGSTAMFDETLYIGPKLQSQLDKISPRLDLVADYGHLTLLAKPLFWLLDKVHAVTGNWGFAIIFVTFLLKLVFYPLSEASGKSMAKMKTLSPRIKNLQETYKDDREKLGKAMMELYQREKINPVAGCLPIIIQIPVFLAFYWVLLESVEMRQAPFAFWINDLSSRDPLFILPAIMAAAMFVQYKLNPAPPDPVQAKVFMIMPLVMSVMFAFFPAGLVLYWVTNTVLSIAQQWNINRRIAAAMKKT
jgi:YidC/Oxa1 family membrane protein insertase